MDFLNLALDQAKLAVGLCYPNPAVGAVIVENNKVISSGFTQQPGQSHAEIMALENLNEKSNNAKLVHFTEGGPYFKNYKHCDYAEEWFDTYKETTRTDM